MATRRTFESLQSDYSRLLGDYKETRSSYADLVSTRLLRDAPRYKQVSELTGVPWEVIAVIHYRESNANFKTHLHNGDPLTKRTVNVPKGRPKGTPPFTWEESAVDAIKYDGLDKVEDWSLERMCYELEKFNGFGYRRKSINKPSPYLWAGTSHYSVGKFASDGKYDSTLVDQQLGVVVLLKRLLANKEISRQAIVNNSRKLTVLQRGRNALAALTTTVLGLDYWDLLGKAKQFANDHAGLLLIGGAASIWLVFKLIEAWSIQDYKDGRYTPSKEGNE